MKPSTKGSKITAFLVMIFVWLTAVPWSLGGWISPNPIWYLQWVLGLLWTGISLLSLLIVKWIIDELT